MMIISLILPLDFGRNLVYFRINMPVILYPRQRQILNFIKQYINKFGYAPTLQEIGKEVGISTVSTIHEHLKALEKKEVIKRPKGRPRAIEVTDEDIQPAPSVNLPILGYIAAGKPIEAYDEKGAKLSVSTSLISGNSSAYVLQIKGDSLVEEGILDGDFVVVEATKEVKNGDIVVALLQNGLSTLKRFFKEATRIRLEPANSKMAPIYVANVTIQGKVVSVVRKYLS